MTKKVKIGKIEIGGEEKIAIQSMTTTDTCDVDATVCQIVALQQAGCDLVRVAVLNESAAFALSKIKSRISIPLIADIHFDGNLAIIALENGADKVRLNPGNVGLEKFKEVVLVAKKLNKAIRIGVNCGSLDKEMEQTFGNTPMAMVESALKFVQICKDFEFENVVVSLKSSTVLDTIQACRLFAQKCDLPQHIGVTESGGGEIAVIKSAIGIGSLLIDGIGDTLRVSLTDNPLREIEVGKSVLRAIGKDKDFCEVVSCPTCGRCKINLFELAEKVRNKVKNIRKPLKVAVMGCVVNGPGEAKHADLGIAGGETNCVVFKHGVVFLVATQEVALNEFFVQLDKMVEAYD